MPYKIKTPSKKSMLEPEELVSRSEILIDQVLQHRRWIAIGTALVLMVAVAAGGSFWYVSEQNRKARLLEYEAMKLTSGRGNDQEAGGPQYQLAAQRYEEVLTLYPGSASAPFAQFQLGNVYYEMGRYDEALAAYQTFIERYADARTLLPMVRQRKGYAHLATGDLKSALAEFEQVTRVPDAWNKPQAHYEAGRVHEGSGDNEAAISQYESLIKAFPRSPWAQEAQTRLKALGVFETPAADGGGGERGEGQLPGSAADEPAPESKP